MRDAVEAFIQTLCSRTGVSYGGYHTLSAGQLDGEGCPKLVFHVSSDQYQPLQPEPGDVFLGTGIAFIALVGSSRTVVRNESGEVVGEYLDLTRHELFGSAERPWWKFW
jgi:hypothetical protein